MRSESKLTIESLVDGVLINLILGTGVLVGEPVVRLEPEGFRDTKEEESHGDSRREEHGEVGDVRELRLGVLGTELDVSISESHVDHEEHEEGTREDVKPSEVEGDLSLGVAERREGVFGRDHTPDGEAPEDQHAQNGRHRVEGDRVDGVAELEGEGAHGELFNPIFVDLHFLLQIDASGGRAIGGLELLGLLFSGRSGDRDFDFFAHGVRFLRYRRNKFGLTMNWSTNRFYDTTIVVEKAKK